MRHKGYKHTKETKEKIRKRALEYNAAKKPVVINGVHYLSIADAIRDTNKTRVTLLRWIKDEFRADCYYLE